YNTKIPQMHFSCAAPTQLHDTVRALLPNLLLLCTPTTTVTYGGGFANDGTGLFLESYRCSSTFFMFSREWFAKIELCTEYW
ncbi:MAG: hypothetical protein P8Y45_07115, partial [Exilibacterium sp.]